MGQKPAIYHSPDGSEPIYAVLKENSDGTVDLGDADGNLIIGKCSVTEDGTVGTCSLIKRAEAKAAEKKSEK